MTCKPSKRMQAIYVKWLAKCSGEDLDGGIGLQRYAEEKRRERRGIIAGTDRGHHWLRDEGTFDSWAGAARIGVRGMHVPRAGTHRPIVSSAGSSRAGVRRPEAGLRIQARSCRTRCGRCRDQVGRPHPADSRVPAAYLPPRLTAARRSSYQLQRDASAAWTSAQGASTHLAFPLRSLRFSSEFLCVPCLDVKRTPWPPLRAMPCR